MNCNAAWTATVITMFPQCFPGTLEVSILGRALSKQIWNLEVVNLRNYATNSRVDDAPYGGGAGMVVKPEVLAAAIDDCNKHSIDALIYLTPRGEVLDHNLAIQYSKLKHVCIICGRFEGIDQRLIEAYSLKELSIGDYVLAGGEAAALVLIEAIVRLLPGVVQNPISLYNESFTNGLLEYSQYTRPPVWRGLEVPTVLRNGNHQQIEAWREQDSIRLTKKIRPDLIEKKAK